MKRLFTVAVAALAIVGCGSEPEDGLPEVRFGQAECAHCGMLVSDPRFAAAIVAEVDGRRQDLAFDDIGDMVRYERTPREMTVRGRYVGDHRDGRWIPAAEATYVRSEGLHTPMGSGLIAFADRTAAEAKRSEIRGELLSYTDLTAQGDQ